MKLSQIKRLTGGMLRPSADSREIVGEYLSSQGLDPGSLYQELEMDSRFANTHRDISWGGDHVQLHSHNFYELLYCRSTVGVEYLVGSERYRLQKGDLVFVAPGVSHRPILPETMTAPYARDVLWISEEYVQSIRDTFHTLLPQNGRALLRTAGTRWEYLGELFRLGVEEARKQQEGWEAAVAANSLTLLVQLQRASQDAASRPLPAEKPELLDRAMAYVEAHLGERIALGDVARQLYVSESTISQTFRKKMGVSFYRCVTQRRLIEAKSLIAQDLALETVAERVGFSDYSTFFRAFKQEYGISPRQYRKMLEDGEKFSPGQEPGYPIPPKAGG